MRNIEISGAIGRRFAWTNLDTTMDQLPVAGKHLVIQMPDGSKWGVPVLLIAQHRASVYVAEFDGSIERSLAEDTLPHFQDDDYNVRDWAANNMNWDDVKGDAILVAAPEVCDKQEGWVNGDYEVRSIQANIVNEATALLARTARAKLRPDEMAALLAQHDAR